MTGSSEHWLTAVLRILDSINIVVQSLIGKIAIFFDNFKANILPPFHLTNDGNLS